MLPRMKTITGAGRGTSETVKRTLLGGGLYGGAQLGAGCALGCLLVWVILALVIVLLWALIAFIASVIPL